MKFSALVVSVSSFLVLSFGTAPALGEVVKLQGTPTTLQGVSIFPEAVVQTLTGPVTVHLTGRGTRTKLGGFVKVYVAASYVSDLAGWRQATSDRNIFNDPDRVALMAAVNAQPVRVLVLTMRTGLSSDTIQKSFSDALKENDVPMTTPGIEDVLSRFDVSLKTGESVTIATFPDGKQQKLVVETLGKTADVTADSLGTNFWKIWFRKGDNELLTLQKALVGGAR